MAIQLYVLSQGAPQPDFTSSEAVSPQVLDRHWWLGALYNLVEGPNPAQPDVHLLNMCRPPIVNLMNWLNGVGFVAHPTKPELLTKCACLRDFQTVLASPWYASKFKFQPHGKFPPTSTSFNRGYLKVRDGAADQPGQRGWITKEFYLHNLLCYAMRGPKPADEPNHVAGHLCHHKLCMLPWHLDWMSQAHNVQMGWDKKKNRV